MNWKYDHCSDKARWLAVAALLAVGLVGVDSTDARSRPGSSMYIERLEKLERRVAASERRSADLRADLEARDRRLRREATSLGTANRAQKRIKRRVATRLVAWERVGRKLERAERYLPPGEAGDVAALLARADAAAIRSQMSDIGVLQTIESDVRRTHQLVGERAQLVVELAQSEGQTDAVEGEREHLVDEATSPQGRKKLDRELDQAGESMERSLGMLLKNDTRRDFHRLKGTLLPPVSSAVTHAYGPRKQKGSMSYVRHTGLTWKIPEATPVKAVASGLVVMAARLEGFGKTVIIDHGQEYHSIYAHLDELDVKVGKKVGRGSLVGKSGDTGSFEGAKLYFELRKDGTPIDPSPWFIQR